LTASELMRFLRDQRIELFFSDGELHYSGPKGSMTPNLLRDLVQNKAEMRSLLRRHAHLQRPAPPLRAVERQGELELSYAQERLWFEEQLSPGSASYNVPVVVRMKGTLDVGALERSLTTVVRRHEALRTTFTRNHSRPVQRVGAPWTVSLNAHQRACPGVLRGVNVVRLPVVLRDADRVRQHEVSTSL